MELLVIEFTVNKDPQMCCCTAHRKCYIGDQVGYGYARAPKSASRDNGNADSGAS